MKEDLIYEIRIILPLYDKLIVIYFNDEYCRYLSNRVLVLVQFLFIFSK